jgi:hypothetical protein
MVPFEWEVTGWWSPEKDSVKWLLVHFLVSTNRRYTFLLGATPQSPHGKLLAIQMGDTIAVDTGPLQVRLTGARPFDLETAILRGRPILQPGPSLVQWKDDEGRMLSCPSWKLKLEQTTALRATVIFTTPHRGRA